MKKILGALAIATATMNPTSGALAADNYYCTGQVGALALNPSGLVTVSIGTYASFVYLCQVGATYQGIAPDVCKAIYATLLTAKATGKNVDIYFSDGGSCT